MFYLKTHFIYGYMVKNLSAREETCYRHYMGYSFRYEFKDKTNVYISIVSLKPIRLAARGRLYALSNRQDIAYHGLCYTTRGALAGRRISQGPP